MEVEVWIGMIEEAGLTEYSEIGWELWKAGRIQFVRPPYLSEEFNAWADFHYPYTILINEPMWTRYPERLDRASILLHELVHIRTLEMTHYCPYWTDVARFREYWLNREEE